MKKTDRILELKCTVYPHGVAFTLTELNSEKTEIFQFFASRNDFTVDEAVTKLNNMLGKYGQHFRIIADKPKVIAQLLKEEGFQKEPSMAQKVLPKVLKAADKVFKVVYCLE